MKKYALVTGGGSGIGLEFSKLLFKKYNLVIVGRNQKKLEQAKEILLKNSLKKVNIVTYCLDLSKKDAAFKLFNKCKQELLDIEVLINNAGCGIYGELTSIENEKITQMLNLNIMTLTLLCKYFGKEMKEKKSGYILNVASLAAYQPVPYISPYAASKSYVLNFSEALSKELEDYGVTVTCLSPGHTDTHFFQNAGIGNDEKGFYGMRTRVSPSKVAMKGLEALFSQKISVIQGFKNKIIANINRFTTRSFTAKISKYLTKNEF